MANATAPLFASCPLTPDEIAYRLAVKRCLWCYDQVDTNQETGFPFHYCLSCRQRPEYKHPPRRPSFNRKAEKERGIQNLDRLLGVSDHG